MKFSAYDCRAHCFIKVVNDKMDHCVTVFSINTLHVEEIDGFTAFNFDASEIAGLITVFSGKIDGSRHSNYVSAIEYLKSGKPDSIQAPVMPKV